MSQQPPGDNRPSVASVQRLLSECLNQLDELGLAVPATHVDHALALITASHDQKLAELLHIAEDLASARKH